MKKIVKINLYSVCVTIVLIMAFFVSCKRLNTNSDYSYINYQKEKESLKKEVEVTDIKNEKGIFLPVFMYHHIKDVPHRDPMPGLFMPKDIFKSQIEELEKLGYESIFMKDFSETLKNNPSKKYAITIDDGYDDNYYNAFEVLKSENVKATIYVIINAIDKPGYLTKNQIKEMQGSGLIEFASHTMNHIDLKKSKDEKIQYEIFESKKELEKILGVGVYSFAYPYGLYDKRAEDGVEKSLYGEAVSTISGAHHENDNFSIKRIRPIKNSGENFKNWFLKLD